MRPNAHEMTCRMQANICSCNVCIRAVLYGRSPWTTAWSNCRGRKPPTVVQDVRDDCVEAGVRSMHVAQLPRHNVDNGDIGTLLSQCRICKSVFLRSKLVSQRKIFQLRGSCFGYLN